MQFYKSMFIGLSSLSWGLLALFNAPLLAQSNSITTEDLILFGDANSIMGGKNQAALDYYNKAIEREPNNAEAYFKRCYLYGNNIYYDTAEHLPYAGVSNVYSDSIKQLDSSQILQRAANDCQQAIALNPNYDLAHAELAFVYLKAGNTAEAKGSANTALQINPNNTEAQRIIATIESGEAEDRLLEYYLQQRQANSQNSQESVSGEDTSFDEYYQRQLKESDRRQQEQYEQRRQREIEEFESRRQRQLEEFLNDQECINKTGFSC